MSKGNTFENELLAHILENADIALIGDATGLRGSTAAGNLFFALHTADPGEAGNQTTNEVVYTGYARASIARTGASWDIVGDGTATLAAVLSFPQRTDAGALVTATHFSLGTSSSGTGKILYKGAITPNIPINQNTIPQLGTGTVITEG